MPRALLLPRHTATQVVLWLPDWSALVLSCLGGDLKAIAAAFTLLVEAMHALDALAPPRSNQPPASQPASQQQARPGMRRVLLCVLAWMCACWYWYELLKRVPLPPSLKRQTTFQ